MATDQAYSRRRFLDHAARVGAYACAGGTTLGARLAAAVDPPPSDVFAGGKRVATLRFDLSRARLEHTYGRGLGGRRLLDLSTLTPETLVIPNERFYIRTRCPDRIDYDAPWIVKVRGEAVPATALDARAEPMGVHLLECSGNGESCGLMSAADWAGVPLAQVVDAPSELNPRTRVLVSGFDDHSSGSTKNGRAGASWIFTMKQLRDAGAFLATRMNGEPLPRDHGFPVRLVMPGWYGCTCIKWVDRIDVVDDDARSTSHMLEFADRTHQRGAPKRAREFRPAVIDFAALPVRVERWEVEGKTIHRIVGIAWGGEETTDRLTIRAKPARRFDTIADFDHQTTRTWTLWTHPWRPPRPGRYEIEVRLRGSTMRSRRMERGTYDRTVRID